MIAKLGTLSSTTDRRISPSPDEGKLAITLGCTLHPPTQDHELLVGFQFDAEKAEPDHPAVINLGLRPLNPEQSVEGWWYRGKVAYRQVGSVRVAECADYTAAIARADDTSCEDFRGLARDTYRHLLAAVDTSRHTRLVRIWNYFGGINVGEHDNERYRLFSAGRADAFSERNIHDSDTPVGTAIGTVTGSDLSLIALASNLPFHPVENPRQVSAFNYPRQYGPSSPKFSRSGLLSTSGGRLFFVSGTASVVGHESAFPYDSAKQLAETLANLTELQQAASLYAKFGEIQFGAEAVLRIYLRDPSDQAHVARVIAARHNGSHPRVLYLHGDICRRELMIEIEAIAGLPPPVT